MTGFADFHNARIPSLLLSSEEQKRPEPVVTTKNGLQGGYQKNSMLVVSKIDILEKQKKLFTLEPHERQVYHEFDK
jgi:hypothetical protein